MNLSVKQVSVKGKVGYSVTDGKKWFIYYYPNKTQANAALANILKANQGAITQNINRDYPFIFVDLGVKQQKE